MPKNVKSPADYILPLYINGLSGRMIRLPAPKGKNREILFIYGSHASLERWWGLALALNKLGAVTMPDLPGLGGMTSLYKIGQTPTIDNLADYLAAFLKLRYKNKKVTILGMSLGFVIVTRMLQKYPHLTSKVDNLISVVGFVHKSDLTFSKKRLFIYTLASKVFARKWPAIFFRYTALQPFLIRSVYHKTINAKDKFAHIAPEKFEETMDMEIKLWHANDVRTQFRNYLDMFSLDNTKKRINLPVYHVAAKHDRYFDNLLVEEHMRRVFDDFTIYYTAIPNHAPTVIATIKDADPFIPTALKNKINKNKH